MSDVDPYRSSEGEPQAYLLTVGHPSSHGGGTHTRNVVTRLRPDAWLEREILRNLQYRAMAPPPYSIPTYPIYPPRLEVVLLNWLPISAERFEKLAALGLREDKDAPDTGAVLHWVRPRKRGHP